MGDGGGNIIVDMFINNQKTIERLDGVDFAGDGFGGIVLGVQ